MCDVIKRCFIVPVWCYQKMFYGSYHFVWIVFHYYPSRNYQGCFLQLLPLLGKRSYQLNNSFQEDIRTYYDNHMFKSMVFLLWLLENCVVNYVCTYVCMYIFHEHYCSDKHNDIENLFITLIESADRRLMRKELHWMYKLMHSTVLTKGMSMKRFENIK